MISPVQCDVVCAHRYWSTGGWYEAGLATISSISRSNLSWPRGQSVHVDRPTIDKV